LAGFEVTLYGRIEVTPEAEPGVQFVHDRLTVLLVEGKALLR
jgi:hypothetical protein